MSSPAATLDAPPVTRPTPTRDPLAAQVFAILTGGLFFWVVTTSWSHLAGELQGHWPDVLFWTALVFLVDLFPLSVNQLRLTLDMPLLLAVALIYSPPLAATVAFVSAFDLREFHAEVGITRAVFNRAQISLSVYMAGLAFGLVAHALSPWVVALAGLALALLADYTTNVLLVSLHMSLLRRQTIFRSFQTLRVGTWTLFLLTYLSYGAMAIVIAALFLSVGAWAVVFFLVPLLGARQLFSSGLSLESLSIRLKERDLLLQQSLDRVVEERRDERDRIAGELHDTVLQSLTEIWFLGKHLERAKELPSAAGNDVRLLVETTEASMESLRSAIRDLKTSPVSSQGLVHTLTGLVQDLKLAWHRRIEMEFPEQVDLLPELQMVLYQIAREGMMNALQHSEADRIVVALNVEAGQVILSIDDDGIGFDPGDIDSSEHFGLRLAEERASKCGGKFLLRSAPEKGTRLLVSVLLSEDRGASDTL